MLIFIYVTILFIENSIELLSISHETKIFSIAKYLVYIYIYIYFPTNLEIYNKPYILNPPFLSINVKKNFVLN